MSFLVILSFLIVMTFSSNFHYSQLQRGERNGQVINNYRFLTIWKTTTAAAATTTTATATKILDLRVESGNLADDR
jgi:hypothetical protein